MSYNANLRSLSINNKKKMDVIIVEYWYDGMFRGFVDGEYFFFANCREAAEEMAAAILAGPIFTASNL